MLSAIFVAVLAGLANATFNLPVFDACLRFSDRRSCLNGNPDCRWRGSRRQCLSITPEFVAPRCCENDWHQRCNRAEGCMWLGASNVCVEDEITLTLRGDTGEEEIRMTVGNEVQTVKLTTSNQDFVYSTPESGTFSASFLNDNGPRNCRFAASLPTTVIYDRWAIWRCGSETEDERCQLTRDGLWATNGVYDYTIGLGDVAYEYVHDGRCAGGLISTDNSDVDSIFECYEYCAEAASCGFFAYSSLKKSCARYTLAGGCSQDDGSLSYASYRLDRASISPMTQPSCPPTSAPTIAPTPEPTNAPTAKPSPAPTAQPTPVPTVQPSAQPTAIPTAVPTAAPSAQPTAIPTAVPTAQPSAQPTAIPTAVPTAQPSAQPSAIPTAVPTAQPSAQPTANPTAVPTAQPSALPTAIPTAQPSAQPTSEPTIPNFDACLQFGDRRTCLRNEDCRWRGSRRQCLSITPLYISQTCSLNDWHQRCNRAEGCMWIGRTNVCVEDEVTLTMSGDTGDEQVTMEVGNEQQMVTLETSEQEFVYKTPHNGEFSVHFHNDNGPRICHMSTSLPTVVDYERFGVWNCGSDNEDERCQDTRDGLLAVNGEYKYTIGTGEVAYELFHPGHCAGGLIAPQILDVDSLDECYEVCADEPSCGFFSYSEAGELCLRYTLAGGCQGAGQPHSFNSYRLYREQLSNELSAPDRR